MPETIGGLIIFAVFLTPGFLNYIQRKGRAPVATLSPLVETATFVSVSVATNFIAIGVFSLIRYIAPNHTPNVELLVSQGPQYVDPRIGYITLWILCLFGVSSVVAVVTGRWPGPLGKLVTPIIVDESAWYNVFLSAPKDSVVYVGCDLNDGSYVGGLLVWFNTNIEEEGDRDLVLGAPLTIGVNGAFSESAFSRMILSARNIVRMSVAFLRDPDVEDQTPAA